MNYKDITLKGEYVGGMVFTTHSIRKYKYTITSKNKRLNGKCFISEVYTKKDAFRCYKEREISYYLDSQSKRYKSLKWLIKYMDKIRK